MSIERGPTPRTEDWKQRLIRALEGHGERVALARFLADGDETAVPSRQVQIAKVINQGRMPEPEFVLATLEWMDNHENPVAKASRRAENSRNQKARRKPHA